VKQPDNYFAEVEQSAFAPAHMVPGVEPSVDPVLQARLFSYPDSQRHRLGVNYQQIPVNRPLVANNPYQRDGFMAINGNYRATPNYPSTSHPIRLQPRIKKSIESGEHEIWTGSASRVQFDVTEDDYVQPKALWEVLGRQEGQQEHLITNVSSHLKNADPAVRERTYAMFSNVDPALGAWLSRATEEAAAV
jgi:catalase